MGSIKHLSPEHRDLLERGSAISTEVIRQRGYFTATSQKGLEGTGLKAHSSMFPALVIPIYPPGAPEPLSYQLRLPYEPEKGGKYRNVPGQPIRIDCPPCMHENLKDPKQELWITEGVKKADSAASHRLCCIALAGVWNWRGTNTKGGSMALGDWDSIPLKGRTVVICFDADVMTKPQVKAALLRLAGFLKSKGANVRVANLSMTQLKMDDFFAGGGTVEELRTLVSDRLPEENSKPKPLQADKAIALAKQKGLTLWRDGRGSSFATIPTRNGPLNVPCDSDELRGFLYEMRSEIGGVSSNLLKQIIEQLTCEAKYEGQKFSVAKRIWSAGGKAYLFLADDKQQILEIDADGWRIAAPGHVPVKFVASSGVQPLPMPIRGGSTEVLRKLINVVEEDFEIAVAWLLGTFSPSGGFPILVATGEAGSGKSFGCEMLKSIIDPKEGPRVLLTNSQRDIGALLENNFTILFDNVSHVPGDLSDILCQVSTGGAITVRGLYTNSDEYTILAKNPLILNGITALIGKPDLQDRCLNIRFTRLEGTSKNTDEHTLRSWFKEMHPAILGAILDGVSAAFRNIETVRKGEHSWLRLTDFSQWYTASEPEESRGRFLSMMHGRRSDMKLQLLDNDVLGSALVRLMENDPRFEGTAGDVLKKLKESESFGKDNPVPSEFPKNGSQFAKQVDRLRDALRTAGISIERNSRRTNRGYTYTIARNEAEQESQLSHLSPATDFEPEEAYEDPFESDSLCDTWDQGSPEVSPVLPVGSNLFDFESDSSDCCDSGSAAFLSLKLEATK